MNGAMQPASDMELSKQDVVSVQQERRARSANSESECLHSCVC